MFPPPPAFSVTSGLLSDCNYPLGHLDPSSSHLSTKVKKESQLTHLLKTICHRLRLVALASPPYHVVDLQTEMATMSPISTSSATSSSSWLLLASCDFFIGSNTSKTPEKAGGRSTAILFNVSSPLCLAMMAQTINTSLVLVTGLR